MNSQRERKTAGHSLGPCKSAKLFMALCALEGSLQIYAAGRAGLLHPCTLWGAGLAHGSIGSFPDGANASSADVFWGVMLWVGSCVWLLHSHCWCCGTGGGAALLQHPRMNLLKDKSEPQIRSGAESPEFGAVGKLG